MVPYIILDGVHMIKSHFTLFISAFITYFLVSFLPLFYLIYLSFTLRFAFSQHVVLFLFIIFLLFLLQAHNFDNFDNQSVDSYTYDAPGIEDNDCDVDRFRQRESYEREVGVVCCGVLCCVVVVWCGVLCCVVVCCCVCIMLCYVAG